MFAPNSKTCISTCMETRALHLAILSHTAVAKAIRKGNLVRKPCEACGASAQAHQDSYYPDKWLDVRWLCPKHHKHWHADNEPIWPTIYEFHPSDVFPSGDHTGGRPGHPWFRTQTKSWYAHVAGKAVPLGRDREAAFAKYEQIKAEKLRLESIA